MPRRTRANPSPGGLKSLDDVVPKRRGRKAAVKIEQSIESVDTTITNTTTAEASVDVAFTQSSQSPPPTNTSRSYSPESRSQSPLPIESRSTSPPVVTTATSNDASSDNDVTTPKRQSQRLSPLTSGRKRARIEEDPVTPVAGTPEGKEEVEEQRSNKRARKSPGDSLDSPSKSDKSEREPQEKGSGRRSARKTERQTPTRRSTPTKSQPRGRRQPDTQVNPESSSDEVTEKQPSPVRVRSKSTSRPSNVASSRSPRQVVQENTSIESKQSTQPEHVSAGPSQLTRAPKLTLPAPSLQPAPQKISTLPPLKPSDIPTDPDERMEFAAKRFNFEPVTFGANLKPYPPRRATPRSKSDIIRARFISRGILPKESLPLDTVEEAQTEQTKTAAASSSETLSTSDINSAARRTEDGLLLTDPYLVTVAQAFTAHKDQSKQLPTIEEIQAFLAAYSSQDAAGKASSQSIFKSSQQPSSSKATRRQSLEAKVIKRNSLFDNDDDMSDAEELKDSKTPEPEQSPIPPATPSSVWRPFTFVASLSNIITSPFRSKATIAPVEPYIFNPPTSSRVVGPKRMPQTERKRIVRDNGKGRSVPRTERPKRNRDYTQIPIEKRGILTPAEVAEIHRAQDEYARKMGHPNADLQSSAREKRRAANLERDESSSLASAQLATPAKTGEKRGVNGEVKSSKKPWNQDLPSSDEEEDDKINSPTPLPSVSKKPRFHLGMTSIYRAAGWHNRLSRRQLEAQKKARDSGDLLVPLEEKNDYEYLKELEGDDPIDPPLRTFPLPYKSEEEYQAYINMVLDPNYEYEHNNPFKNCMPQKKRTNVFAQMQEQQRKAEEAKKKAEASAAQSQKTPVRRGGYRVPECNSDESDEEETASEVAQGSRILEPKQWPQVPPPKPRPANAQLPQTDLTKTAVADPNQKEAIQHAIQNANRHAPRKPSNLRNMSTLSPLQVEQQERDKQLSKGKGKETEKYPWDFEEYDLDFDVLPEVLAAIQEAEADRFLPMTPIPDEILSEVYSEAPNKLEAVAAAEQLWDVIEAQRISRLRMLHGLRPQHARG